MTSRHTRRGAVELFGWTLTGLGLLAIIGLTLRPTDSTSALPFWCLKCGERPGVDYLLNVLLFIPLGAGLVIAGMRPWRAALCVVAVTCAVELLQSTVIPGRFPAARDLVTNSIGGWIGALLGFHWRLLLAPTAGAARALFACAVAGWLGTQAITAWMLAIEAPPPPWWVQIRPDHDRFPSVFDGDIVALALGSTALMESDQLPDAEPVRQQLIRGDALRAVVTRVRPSDGAAPIITLAAGPTEVALLGQDGRDAVYRIRLRGSGVGLRSPSLRLDDAFTGDTVWASGTYTGGSYHLTATRNGRVVQRTLHASPSWLWSFLMPIPNYAFGNDIHALTALWLIGIVVWIGFWGAQVRTRPSYMTVAMLAAFGIALAAIPLGAGLSVAHWSEWVAALLGVMLGWTGGKKAARHGPGGNR